MTEERIRELVDRSLEMIESEEQREKRMKTGAEPQRPVGQYQRANICVTRVPEGQEKELGAGKEKN